MHSKVVAVRLLPGARWVARLTRYGTVRVACHTLGARPGTMDSASGSVGLIIGIGSGGSNVPSGVQYACSSGSNVGFPNVIGMARACAAALLPWIPVQAVGVSARPAYASSSCSMPVGSK
eukprot:352425-Chlamydomonas_euryale.AAC.3